MLPSIPKGFEEPQKCWAHLIRKGHQADVTSPEDSLFSSARDVLAIYRDAKRISNDGRSR